MTIEIGVLIAVIGATLSVATFFFGRQSVAKKSGESAGEMKSTLIHMADDIKEIKAEMRAYREQNVALDRGVTELKRDVKTAFSRIDELRGEVARLSGYHTN